MTTKFKFIVSSVLFLGIIIGFLSMHAMPENTQKLEVLTTIDGVPVAEAMVGISTSPENRENGKYISEKETASNGKVIFQSLAQGTYYLDAFVMTDDGDYYAEADVTLEGEVTNLSIALKLEE